MNMKHTVLVAICVKPGLNPLLVDRCYQLAARLPEVNLALDITTMFYHAVVERLESDSTPWSKVTRARNAMLRNLYLGRFQYVLFIDADVVSYPLNFPSRAIEVNPTGITAPLVLVEDSDRFYDTAAFIISGQSVNQPDHRPMIRGRNLAHEPPYWPERPQVDLVPMDCVGTMLMYPARLLINQTAPFVDHPAFTDHFALCLDCRESGSPVLCDRLSIAYHANLPKYGEAWH